MKLLILPLVLVAFLSSAESLLAGDNSWDGEYADKKFMNGQAALQLSIEQQGGKIQISFDCS